MAHHPTESIYDQIVLNDMILELLYIIISSSVTNEHCAATSVPGNEMILQCMKHGKKVL